MLADAVQVTMGPKVGRCRLTVPKPVLKALLVSALETKKLETKECDERLSNFAFKFNLSRFAKGRTVVYEQTYGQGL